jgi:hypothetical protein
VKGKSKPLVTKGRINKAIDVFLHPKYAENQSYRILDGLLHAAVEQDPKSSVKKFVRYNLKDIIEELAKKL